MNLKHLNLDLYNIPEDEEIQVAVFLIATDLKSRKLVRGLTSIGCDNCFCTSDLSDLVLALTGFDDRTDDLYGFYFDLLDQYCDKVTYKNDKPVNEAFLIYKQLRGERQKLLN